VSESLASSRSRWGCHAALFICAARDVRSVGADDKTCIQAAVIVIWAIVCTHNRIVTFWFCASLCALILLSAPLGGKLCLILAAVDGQAALLVGETLPFESVGIRFLVPLGVR